jgi:hypothetical protein
MNLGTKVVLVLVCLSFVFTIAPRTCTAEEIAAGHSLNVSATYPDGSYVAPCNANSSVTYGYGTGWNKIADALGGASADSTSMVSNLLLLLVGAGVVLAVTTTLFPNAFTLFASFIVALLGIFVTMPWDLLGGTDQLGLGGASGYVNPVIVFFLAVLTLLFTVSVMSFFKGNDF